MGDNGQMDIRLPIGLMFGLMGIMLVVYGLMTMGSPIYTEHSLGINVNLCWGGTLCLFGLVMLGLVWKSSKAKSK